MGRKKREKIYVLYIYMPIHKKSRKMRSTKKQSKTKQPRKTRKSKRPTGGNIANMEENIKEINNQITYLAKNEEMTIKIMTKLTKENEVLGREIKGLDSRLRKLEKANNNRKANSLKKQHSMHKKERNEKKNSSHRSEFPGLML